MGQRFHPFWVHSVGIAKRCVPYLYFPQFGGLPLKFRRSWKIRCLPEPRLARSVCKERGIRLSQSVGKESAGESRSLAASVAFKQRIDFWQQSHRHCPPLPFWPSRHSRFQWGKPVQEVTARIGLQSSRIVDDVRSVIVLAFAIVSPATESAPDKDLRRIGYATCDLELRDVPSRPSAFSALFGNWPFRLRLNSGRSLLPPHGET